MHSKPRLQTYNKNPTPHDRAHDVGQLRITLAGFSLQEMISVQNVLGALEKIPNHHLQGLKTITYDPDRVFQEPEDDSDIPRPANPHSKGEFIPHKRSIAIYDFDSRAQFEHILYHEIGHYVYFRILNKSAKKAWVSAIAYNDDHITDYAATNASEDFAESYAIFVQDPKALESLADKYRFLRDHVFTGIATNLGQGHLDFSA